MTPLNAIDIAIGLSTLALRFAEASQAIHVLSQKAVAEGRELNDAEIAAIREYRKSATSRLEAIHSDIESNG